MYTINRPKILAGFLFAFSLLASSASLAWHGHGGYDRHYHRPHHDWAYGGGGFNYGGWDGPNVIINVPVPGRRYVPECHRVEVCNPYGRCWLETQCD